MPSRQREPGFNLTSQGYLPDDCPTDLHGKPAGPSQSFFFFSFLSSLSFSLRRLVKRAFPSPVPTVSTPQRSTSCMNGTSERPCATPSLCISTPGSWSPIGG